MTFEDVSPIVSGLVGGAAAIWLSQKLSRWIPAALHGKPAHLLVKENRAAIWTANTASALGLFGALALYEWGGYARNDWRPGGLGFGVLLVSPLVVLPLMAVLQNRSVKECLVGYAISQGMPIPAIYGLLLVGVPLLIASAVALL